MQRTRSLARHSHDAAASTPSSPQQQHSLPVVDSVLDYEKLHRIGEGTYGVVYKGKSHSKLSGLQTVISTHFALLSAHSQAEFVSQCVRAHCTELVISCSADPSSAVASAWYSRNQGSHIMHFRSLLGAAVPLGGP
jgi:hypothetical protein